MLLFVQDVDNDPKIPRKKHAHVVFGSLIKD